MRMVMTRIAGATLVAAVLGAAGVRAAASWASGDVFVAIALDRYQVWRPGSPGATLTDTVADNTSSGGPGSFGFTAGCAINLGAGKVYATNYSNQKIAIYDDALPHAVSTVDALLATPESILVRPADGHLFVGHDGWPAFSEYDGSGAAVGTHALALPDQNGDATGGTNQIDLAADGRTIFFTDQSREIFRYDLTTDTSLASFVTGLGQASGTAHAGAVRILPPGDGTGGVLLADEENIKRLNGSGQIVWMTTGAAGPKAGPNATQGPVEDGWVTIALDPDGTTFWAGNDLTGEVWRFNISNGAPVNHFSTGFTGDPNAPSFGFVFGLCVRGGAVANTRLAGEMSGDARVWNMTYGNARYDANVQCDVAKVDQRHDREFEVIWSRFDDEEDFDFNHERGHRRFERHSSQGKKFVMTEMTAAACTHNPSIILDNPKIGFDTHTGAGTGRLSGTGGYSITWVLVDAGRRKADLADITITDRLGRVVYHFAGAVTRGRNEARRDDDRR